MATDLASDEGVPPRAPRVAVASSPLPGRGPGRSSGSTGGRLIREGAWLSVTPRVDQPTPIQRKTAMLLRLLLLRDFLLYPVGSAPIELTLVVGPETVATMSGNRRRQEWMSTEDVAREIGMTPQWVRRQINDGRLSARVFEVGERRTFRVSREQLEAFLERFSFDSADPEARAERGDSASSHP